MENVENKNSFQKFLQKQNENENLHKQGLQEFYKHNHGEKNQKLKKKKKTYQSIHDNINKIKL